MSALPDALLLDLDDTILDFDSGAEPCWTRVAEHFAPRFSDFSQSDFLASIDRARNWFWADPERHRQGRLDLGGAREGIVARALSELGVKDDPALAGEIRRAYEKLRLEEIRPFPRAIEALGELRERGVPMALLTNGDAAGQRHKIERFELAPYFRCIVIEGEFGVGKPDERVYRHTLEQLGSHPSRAWMVGDNLEWEIVAPQKLGIFSIWIDAAGKGLPSGSPVKPDRVIRSLWELVK